MKKIGLNIIILTFCLTLFGQGSGNEVKAVNPDTIITVASVRNNVFETANLQLMNGQRAWEWLDKGWIDGAFITVYLPNTNDVVEIVNNFNSVLQNESSRDKVFPGLASYNLDDREAPWEEITLEQVNAVRTEMPEGSVSVSPPMKGLAFFIYRHLTDETAQMLAEGPFKSIARPTWVQD